MKKQILIASLVAFSTASFAQQVITNKGDKLNVSDLKVEPWRVEGTATQATGNTQKIYQNNAVGIGDFTGTTMPAGSTLNIKPTGNIQLRFLSPTGASFSEYFLDGDYATRKAWFGFGSGTTPTLFTINNSIADGVINIDSKTVGVKTPSPLTDFQVSGSGLVTGNLSVAFALYNNVAPANDSYLNVGIPAGDNKAAARFSINNCGAPCGQGVAKNIVLNNFNSTASRYASIAFVASGGNLAVDPAPATELSGIDRDPNNNYGGLAISTRDAAGYSSKLAVHASGRVDIANVGAAADNTLTKVLAVNASGQVGYVDKSAIAAAGTTIPQVTNAINNTTAAAGSDDKNLQDAIANVSKFIEPWRVAGGTTNATSNTENIYQNGNVGIGDFSAAAPTQKLDVKGNTKAEKSFVTNMGRASNSNADNFTNVAVDNTTGELVKVQSNTGNTKPINYVEFNIETNPGEDFVKDFDTGISTNQYTVLLINAVLLDAFIPLKDGKVPPFNYRAFVNGSTWRLTADYKDTAPNDVPVRTYHWKLIALVMQNTQVKDLGTFSRSLDGGNNGAIGTPAIPGL